MKIEGVVLRWLYDHGFTAHQQGVLATRLWRLTHKQLERSILVSFEDTMVHGVYTADNWIGSRHGFHESIADPRFFRKIETWTIKTLKRGKKTDAGM